MMRAEEQYPYKVGDKIVGIPPQSNAGSDSLYQGESNLLVFMPGAFHTGETFNALRKELEKRGQETMAVTFDHSNSEATAESDADQVASEIGNRRGVVLVAWSRAVEALVRLPYRLEEGQLAGAVAFGTGGPQKFLLPLEEETEAANPRYKPGYTDHIRKTDSNLYVIDEQAAKHYFYHDIPETEADAALSIMVPQKENISDEPLKSWDPDMPTLLLLGRSDRVLDVMRARAVGRRFFHANTEMMDGGHTLHLSHTKELGRRIIQFVNEEVAAIKE